MDLPNKLYYINYHMEKLQQNNNKMNNWLFYGMLAIKYFQVAHVIKKWNITDLYTLLSDMSEHTHGVVCAL